MPLKPTSLVLSALLLAPALSGCAAEPKLQPIPAPVVERLVYRPIDSGLLTCRQWPAGEGGTDLDAVSEANRGFDAWLDCWRKIEKIKELLSTPH